MLTLATDMGGLNCLNAAKDNVLSLCDKKGIVGHAIIRYKTGGKILVSCGHWI